eukprot:3743535-Amphidinium_carterae.1
MERAWGRAMEATLATVKTMNEEEKRAATNLSQPNNPANGPGQHSKTPSRQRWNSQRSKADTVTHTLHSDEWCSSCLKNRPRPTEGWLTKPP